MAMNCFGAVNGFASLFGTAAVAIFARSVYWAGISLLASVAVNGKGADELFAELKEVASAGRFYGFHDMHGNARRALQDLTIGRFEFTKAICDEIDRDGAKNYKGYREALCGVLGFVKDPAAIPWLRSKRRSAEKSLLLTSWLPEWRSYLSGASPRQLRWFAKEDEWFGFFSEWLSEEKDAAIRVDLLGAVRGWIHTSDALRFFERIADDAQSAPEEFLSAQLYVYKHGGSFRVPSLQKAIEKLSKTAKGRQTLLEHIEDMPHEMFVPWLLSVVERRQKEDVANPQWCLERITFRLDVKGRQGWVRWHKQWAETGRNGWLQEASRSIIDLAADDIANANKLLNNAMYRWKDPVMLATMEKLAEHPQLHPHIVGWINLTYHHHPQMPGLRDSLRALALRLKIDGEDNLSKHYRRMMQEWDFVNEDAMTWERYVRLANMAA